MAKMDKGLEKYQYNLTPIRCYTCGKLLTNAIKDSYYNSSSPKNLERYCCVRSLEGSIRYFDIDNFKEKKKGSPALFATKAAPSQKFLTISEKNMEEDRQKNIIDLLASLNSMTDDASNISMSMAEYRGVSHLVNKFEKNDDKIVFSDNKESIDFYHVEGLGYVPILGGKFSGV